MTRCRFRVRPVWHETDVVIDGRALCVSERPALILLRLKGTRQSLSLPWGVAWFRAAMLRVQEQTKVKTRRRAVTRGRL